ncbi:MAG TPA: glycosyltransferase [Campylobacterales bacterium]|nr:glycosyltransferase [Campylobacterales bacterium]
MALISILIPAYNHQAYVVQTLESILNDGFKDKEIVIINDGSTDHTDEIIKRWIDKNSNKIKIIYKSRENRGLTKTLNELLSLSSGSYLVALASDDYLLDGGLEKRYQYLILHPEKYAVFSDCIVVDNENKKTHNSGLFDLRNADKNRLLTDSGIKKEFISNFAVPGPVLMVRRGFYTQFGGFNEKMYMEDFDLYLKFASKSLIGFLDEKVSAYRVHDTNMSSVKNQNFIKLLEDSKKTLMLHWNNFYGFNKFLLLKEIIKFTIRIQVCKFKNR